MAERNLEQACKGIHDYHYLTTGLRISEACSRIPVLILAIAAS